MNSNSVLLQNRTSEEWPASVLHPWLLPLLSPTTGSTNASDQWRHLMPHWDILSPSLSVQSYGGHFKLSRAEHLAPSSYCDSALFRSDSPMNKCIKVAGWLWADPEFSHTEITFYSCSLCRIWKGITGAWDANEVLYLDFYCSWMGKKVYSKDSSRTSSISITGCNLPVLKAVVSYIDILWYA